MHLLLIPYLHLLNSLLFVSVRGSKWDNTEIIVSRWSGEDHRNKHDIYEKKKKKKFNLKNFKIKKRRMHREKHKNKGMRQREDK